MLDVPLHRRPTSPARCSARPARRRVGWLAALCVLVLMSVTTGPAWASALPAPTELALSAAAADLTYGGTTVLSARVRSGAAPAAGALVAFRQRRIGTTAYTTLGSATTDEAGVARLTVSPDATTYYVAQQVPDDAGAASASSVRRVVVRHRVRAALSSTAVPLGRWVGVAGTLTPARNGWFVRVERFSRGRWVLVTRAVSSASGRWAATVPTRSSRGFSRFRVVVPGSSRLGSALLTLPLVDSYSLHTYSVRTRGRITVSMTDFAARARATYADPRGWAKAHHRFARVRSGGSFTLVMSQARYLPSFSSVCSVQYSCRAGRYVVINQDRWRSGSRPFTGSLLGYRRMVVNHETGHWLGLGHAYCGGAGRLAPVMQQQSKSMQGCRPSSWPLPAELRAVS